MRNYRLMKFATVLLAAASAHVFAAEAPLRTDNLKSGVKVEHYIEGDGPKPEVEDRVVVHYHGVLQDGTVFDTTYKLGVPTRLPLANVIPCWQQALPRMALGGKAIVTCPPSTAYGAAGAGSLVPPNSVLKFEIDLLGIN